MSIKSLIVPRIAQRLLGEARVNKHRAKFERERLMNDEDHKVEFFHDPCLLYTSPSPRDATLSRMPSSA